ncbi:MAG: hypothetical protein AMXMBFR34_09730 [Myxococcaceae bacterium]
MSALPRSSLRRSTELLYRQYGPAVYARCRRLLKDDDLAEDATQEVFVRVLRHLDDVPADTPLKAWLLCITTNHCLNHLRDTERRHQLRLENPPETSTPPPQAALMHRQWAQSVVAAAPAKLRPPAELYFLEDLHQTAVAAALGLSRRTVISRLQDFVARTRASVALEDAR